jgi:hypothetical protein
VLTDLIHLHDVRARQAGHRLGLADHAGADRRLVEQLLADQLQRDLAVEADVVAGVDDAHGPLAELAMHDERANGCGVFTGFGHATGFTARRLSYRSG